MKLHYAAASPYVRKVRVVAHELGLSDRIELIEHAVTPTSPVDRLNRDNPLGKIPALVLDDGGTLFDSRVITEYLSEIGGGLLPVTGDERRQAKVLEALGDGMNDALVITRYETFLRPEALRWQDWVDNQLAKAERAMAHLEGSIDHWSNSLSIGSIAVACALDYADFRFADLGWRDRHSRLAVWQDDMAGRESMRATAPA